MALDAVLVNAVYPQRFTAAEARRLEAARRTRLRRRPARPRGRRSPSSGARAPSAPQVARLRRAADAPVFTLPFLFEPDIALAQLERLSRRAGAASL